MLFCWLFHPCERHIFRKKMIQEGYVQYEIWKHNVENS